MHLRLIERWRAPNHDRYAWRPFVQSDLCTPEWWDRTPYTEDDPRYIQATIRTGHRVTLVMSIRLGLAAALGVLLTAAGCSSAAPGALNRSAPPSRSLASASQPPLTGTEWQLASYSNPGSAQRVTVTTDSTAEFSTKGHFSAHACNFLGGAVTMTSDRIFFSTVGSTLMACGGEPGQLNRQVEATLTGSVSWAITGRVLTLTNPDGHALVYRVRPSSYPDPEARTTLAGTRAGGQYRIAVKGPADGGSHLTLESSFIPSKSPVTFYDDHGKVIAAYPHGPC